MEYVKQPCPRCGGAYVEVAEVTGMLDASTLDVGNGGQRGFEIRYECANPACGQRCFVELEITGVEWDDVEDDG